jgi:5-formyltetrahydrofolate cyclo-ligase
VPQVVGTAELEVGEGVIAWRVRSRPARWLAITDSVTHRQPGCLQLLLDPERLSMSPWEAATKEGAAKAGRKVAATELPSVDLVVCGSVAVNREGARIGKGGGFSDLEVAFLVEAGVLRPDTVLATTVHPLQVVDEPLAETIHDFRVDLIVTPDEAIWCAEPHRPPGILWEHLDQDKIVEVPTLAALAARR